MSPIEALHLGLSLQGLYRQAIDLLRDGDGTRRRASNYRSSRNENENWRGRLLQGERGATSTSCAAPIAVLENLSLERVDHDGHPIGKAFRIKLKYRANP